MRLLVKILNSGDLRYLLHEYDKDYQANELVSVFDSIMIEYDTLRGTSDYSKQLQKIDEALYQNLQLNAICVVIQCLSFPYILEKNHVNTAKNIIDEFNLRYNGKKIEINSEYIHDKEIKILENLYKSIENTAFIRAEKEKSKEGKDITWEKMRIYIQKSLDILPEKDCSVAMYVEYENLAKQLAEERKNG